ncbi:MAG TPA: adenylate/guanylate cyclase domain-containing protein, partial [Candidatus Aminicenantes bacterium]|nr:adenylate/guanylate cyclase domain-containing protein [Candidatus Aminicenantes bacterium]
WIFWGGLLLVLFLLNASLSRIKSLPWQGALSLGVLLLVLAIAFLAYPLGWEVPVLPGPLGVVLAAATDMVRRYRQVRKEKRILKGAFQGYMSAELYRQVMKDPGSLRLGGEKRLVTVYFSDLAGFTTLSEKLDAEALVAVLNEYLGRMTDVIMAHGGFVNKFEGDAIMALWGAPLPDQEQADHALAATLACQRELERLNAEWRERGLHELSMRIGLNSGEVVVGNVGSTQKKEYTVIGDAVNLASRLEGAGKNYGIHRTVGEATRNLASDRFVFRPLDKVRVKGKSQPVEIFELIGFEDEVGEDERKTLAAFDRAQQLYQAGDFAVAAEAFAAIQNDPASQALAGRCRELLAAPPAAWDGTVTFTSK